MEIFTRIIEIVKIPLKVLLPALWLFSGFLTLLNDEILAKFFLLEWRNENGFIIGIIFLVTSCLIVIYAFVYIKDRLSDVIFKATLNKKTIKRLFKLDDTRFSIIIALYHAPGYTKYLNYSEPLVQALFAESFIYAGAQQMISVNIHTNEMPTKFTLQPFVYKALDYYKPKFENKINKLVKKVGNEKNAVKKAKLQESLTNIRDIYDTLYN